MAKIDNIETAVPKCLPPGPPTTPVIGHRGLSLGTIPYMFADAAKEHGDLICLKYFGKFFIGINSEQLMRKAFGEDPYQMKLCDRPDTVTGKYLRYGNKGISMRAAADDTQTGLRKIVCDFVKQYSDGVADLEQPIMEEIHTMVERFRAYQGEQLDPKPIVQKSINSLISIMFSGEPITDEHPAGSHFMAFYRNMCTIGSNKNAFRLGVMPWIRHLPVGVGRAFKETLEVQDKVIALYVDTLKKSHTHGKTRGLVDEFFRVQKETSDNNSSCWLTDDEIGASLIDLLLGAIPATLTTVMGFLLVLLHRPEVQERIHKEVDDLLKRKKGNISVLDEPALPYTEACLLEAFRYLSPAPITLPHTTRKDAELNGSRAPAGCWLFGNIWAAHHTGPTWENPAEFTPERFLDGSGRLLPPEHPVRLGLLPFGTGRRSCPGAAIAKPWIFLIITQMVHEFSFLPPEGGTLPSDHPRSFEQSALLQPKPFMCRIVDRSTNKNLCGKHVTFDQI